MKKIISLLSAVAMLVTMLSTVAFAGAGTKAEWVKDGNKYSLVVTTDEQLSSIGGRFSIPTTLTVKSFSKVDAGNWNVKKGTIAFNLADLDGVTGTIVLGYLEVDTTDKFTFAAVDNYPLQMTVVGSAAGEYITFTDNATGYVANDTPVAEKVKLGGTFDKIEDETIETLAGDDTLTYVAVTDSTNADKYVEITNSKDEKLKSLQTIAELLNGQGVGTIAGKIFIYVKGAADTYTAAYVD